jgi:methanogenic corrinoid protein MtbC1
MDLGCDLPPESFVRAAVDADRLTALGVSVTTPSCLDAARETVEALRAGYPDIPILVGGQCIPDEAAAGALGADHWARDGVAALEVLDRISR